MDTLSRVPPRSGKKTRGAGETRELEDDTAQNRYNGYHFANRTFSLLYKNPPCRWKPFTVNSAHFKDDLNINDEDDS